MNAVGNRGEVAFVLDIPFMEFRPIRGIPNMTAAFTTDIPKLSNWGEPILIGPGSIVVAHTPGEFIAKRQLREAVDLYVRVARELAAASFAKWHRGLLPTVSALASRLATSLLPPETTTYELARRSIFRLSSLRPASTHPVARVGRGCVRHSST